MRTLQAGEPLCYTSNERSFINVTRREKHTQDVRMQSLALCGKAEVESLNEQLLAGRGQSGSLDPDTRSAAQSGQILSSCG